MNYSRILKHLLLSVLTLGSLQTLTARAAELPASVKVYAQNFGNRVVYHYRIINRGPYAIPSVLIGHDGKNPNDSDDDVFELMELPVGWDFDTGIPPTSVKTPTDWEAYMIIPEESEVMALNYGVKEGATASILPGKTLDGFLSITLPKADDAYRNGHAYVYFAGRYPARMTLPLEPDDTTPPALSVSLSPPTPTRKNGRRVSFTATVMVKDNLDPGPVVKLESITSSDTAMAGRDIYGATLGTDDRDFVLGSLRGSVARVYAVTYSATDATGNKSTASTTVTIPGR